MPTVRIPDLLEAILTATADEAGAKARIARIRATLEAEARSRFHAEGAAPSWKTPKLGTVRYDAPGEWAAKVADADAFGSFVAEHFPTEAVATIELADASQLEAALEALEFAGAGVTRSRVEVRSPWREHYLAELVVDVEETPADEDGVVDRSFTVIDPVLGVTVDGLSGDRKPGRLVVSLDRDRRAEAMTEADEEATRILDDATDDTPRLGFDPAALKGRRQALEDLGSEELKGIAKRLELGTSGTKAELAERIARAEALVRNATAGGGFTTPAIEEARYQADKSDGRIPVSSATMAALEPSAVEQPKVLLETEEDRAALTEAVESRTPPGLVVNGLKVDDLRRVARRHGRPISGTKAELLDRLADVLEAEGLAS